MRGSTLNGRPDPRNSRAISREMGQGRHTGLGSTAMANLWEPLRKAGASARAALVAAGAARWKVPADELIVGEGVVSHARSRRRAPARD